MPEERKSLALFQRKRILWKTGGYGYTCGGTTWRCTPKRVLGADNYELAIDLEGKLVELKVSAASTSVYNSVKQLLEDVVPLDYLISVFMYSSTQSDLFYGTATVIRTVTPIYDNGLEV